MTAAAFITACFSEMSARERDTSGICVKSGDVLAFMGDSITCYGNDRAGGYVNLVMKGLEYVGVTNVVKIPSGIPGQTSVEMRARINRLIGNIRYHSPKGGWLTFSCGVNDVWRGRRGIPLERYKKNVSEIFDICAASNVNVIVLTPTPITEDLDCEFNRNLEPYCAFLREEARRRSLPLADLNVDMRAELAEIRKTDKTPGNKLTADGVHMDFTGDRVMAWGVLRAMGVDKSLKDRIIAMFNAKAGSYSSQVWYSDEEWSAICDGAEKAGVNPVEFIRLKTLSAGKVAPFRKNAVNEQPLAVPPGLRAKIIVKDGDRIGFMGDSVCNDLRANLCYPYMAMKGLEVAGVKDVKYILPTFTCGSHSAHMRKNIHEVVFARRDRRKCQWMVLSCGTRDVWHGPHGIPVDQYTENIAAVFDMCAASNVQAVAATPTMITPDRNDVRNKKLSLYVEAVRAEAKKRSIPLADMNSALWEYVDKRAAEGDPYRMRDAIHHYFSADCVMAWTLLKAFGVDDSLKDRVFAAWRKIRGAHKPVVPYSFDEWQIIGKKSAANEMKIGEFIENVGVEAGKAK